MTRYVLVRLIQATVALVIVLAIVFGLAHLSGDPATLLAPLQATDADIARIQQEMGLNRPWLVQFGNYLWDLVRGDLGTSFSYRAPVLDIVAQALPKTVQLAVAAFAFAALGIPLGIAAGMRPGGAVDNLVRTVALTGQSVPNFALGIVLVLVFAVHLGLVPAFGDAGFSAIILPAVALGAFPLASLTRLTRSAVLEVMRKNQTLYLRSKGVSTARFVWHVLKNASLPVVTFSGIQLGTLISGTIVIETLFAWPGIGRLAIQAVNTRDYALLQGVVAINTVIFIGLMFLVDLSYGWLDPRARLQQGGPRTQRGAPGEATV